MRRYKNTGKSDEFTVTFGGSQLFTIDVSEYRSYCTRVVTTPNCRSKKSVSLLYCPINEALGVSPRIVNQRLRRAIANTVQAIMESGFSASDDLSPLDVAGGGKFFLIRLPKDVSSYIALCQLLMRTFEHLEL